MVHILPRIVTYIHCQVSSVCRRYITFINLARNKLKFICLKLRLTHVFDFKWRRGQPCRWLSGTNNWVRAYVGDVIIVWRNKHNNTEPNAIWFPATLTDTDLNIRGIQVNYRTNGNCNIPATESRLWGTKWYYSSSANVCMLRRGTFGGFFYNDFQLNVQELCLQARFFKGLGWACTCQITLRRMSLDLIDKKSKLVQVITWAKFILGMCRHMTSLGHNKVIELYIDSSFTVIHSRYEET